MTRALLLMIALAAWLIPSPAAAQDNRPRIVATTTLIADVTARVAGEGASVTALLGPDTDAHSYQPTPQDVARVAEADLLLVNGAGYEQFLGGLLDNASATRAVVVSDGVLILPLGGADPLGALGADLSCEPGAEPTAEATREDDDGHDHGVCDPHVWMDPANVVVWARNIAAALAALDPDGADAYRANAEAYAAELDALDAELYALLAAVPAERRVLVTSHDFLGYFATAYDFRVGATILGAGSSEAEPDPQTLGALIDRLRALGAPAIFAEMSANTQLAELVAQETGAAGVVPLYSEALSGPDGPAATYADFMRYNARAIAAALGT